MIVPATGCGPGGYHRCLGRFALVVPAAQKVSLSPGLPPILFMIRLSDCMPQGTGTVCVKLWYFIVTSKLDRLEKPSFWAQGHMCTGKPRKSCSPGCSTTR